MKKDNLSIAEGVNYLDNKSISFGTRIIAPIITAHIAAIRTAAAPRSFAIFANGWLCGEIRSMVASIAVLTNSSEITIIIVRSNMVISIELQWRYMDNIVTSEATVK